MSDITIKIDNEFMTALKEKLGKQNLNDQEVVQEALDIFNWAATKKAEGNEIHFNAIDSVNKKVTSVSSKMLDKVPQVK